MKTRTVLIGIAALAIAGGLGWRYGPVLMSDGPPPVRAAPAIPVTAGIAETRDVPVYVQGLGTVQAFNTVNVRSRVDGQITKVFFNEGQDVKTGRPAVPDRSAPIPGGARSGEGQQGQGRSRLQGAQLDLQRYSTLLPSGFQTQQQYDQQKATVGQFQGAVQADQAQIDTAQLNLDYATVRSPIDGRTGQRLVDIGNYVQATQNMNLVTVTQLKPIYVSFTLPQTELDAVRQANEIGELMVDAYGQDNKTLLSQGKLTLIDNQVDIATGTIHLRATFDNNDLRLWPGEFVNARLVLSTKKNAVTVPAETIMQGPDGAYVYVIKPDDTADRRPVTVAMTQEGHAVIDKGLSAGEHVVVEGQYRLTQGGKLQIRSGPGSNNVAEGSTQTTSQNAGSGREPTQ